MLTAFSASGSAKVAYIYTYTYTYTYIHIYTYIQLVEVNAHSLFSKWFSESGKLVNKLFASIHDLIEDSQVWMRISVHVYV